MKINGITIFKNKKCKTWYTRYRKDGKQYYLSGKTQKEVADKLRDALDIKRKEHLPYTTLEAWYNKWFDLFKKNNIKPGTVEQYNNALLHVPDAIMQSNIKTITSLQILEFINKVPGLRTKQKVFELLKMVFVSAKKFNLIKSNPFDLIEKPKYERTLGTALTFDQQQKLIELCNKNKYGDFYLILLFEGLRIGEALAMTRADIDFENLQITINKSLNRSNDFDLTKNTQSIRKLPIFKNSEIILEKFKNLNSNERIFKMPYSTAGKKLREIIFNSELPNISCHDLRHTFITNCKNSDIPEHIVQTWVGHEIGSTVTRTVYTHATDDALNLFKNKLNDSKFYSNSSQKK